MQRPSAQEVHVDAPLTDVSIKFNNSEFIHDKIFPTVTVKKQSDLFFMYGKENFKAVNDERAPGDEARTIFSTLSTGQYFCRAHSLKDKVPDEVKDNADTPIEPEVDATENVTERLLLNKEKRVKACVHSISAGVTVTNKWDSTLGGAPDKEILAGVAYIHSKVFKIANKIIIPYQVAVALTTNPVIKEIVKYTMNILQIGSAILLPNPLWGMEVLIAGAGENTQNLGQGETLSYVWGKDVILAYVNPSPGLKRLSLGYVFQWKTRETSKWYEKKEKSTYVQVEEYCDEKIISLDCGYKLAAAIS